MIKFTPPFELELNSFSITDTVEFRKFLVENNVTVTIVSYTVATYLQELIKTFFDDFIFCGLQNDCNQEQLPTIYKLLKLEIVLYGMHFKIGKLLVAIIKFIISIILVFYISRLLKDIIN